MDELNIDDDLDAAQKRAISCRPSMTSRKEKEKSQLSAKLESRSGRGKQNLIMMYLTWFCLSIYTLDLRFLDKHLNYNIHKCL